MFENLTKTTAKKFLKLQENAGDFTALAAIRAARKKTEEEHLFIHLMQRFNYIITRMEAGDIEWDSEINDFYREGILILIEKCNAILNKKEDK